MKTMNRKLWLGDPFQLGPGVWDGGSLSSDVQSITGSDVSGESLRCPMAMAAVRWMGRGARALGDRSAQGAAVADR